MSLLLAGLSLIGAAVACAAPPANKTPLIVCTAGEDGCPDEAAIRKDRDETDTETETETTRTDPIAPVVTRDGGADAAAVSDPTCAALKPCCAALLKQGIKGSASQCDRVVADNNGFSCQLARDEYRTPDDYYDPAEACK